MAAGRARVVIGSDFDEKHRELCEAQQVFGKMVLGTFAKTKVPRRVGAEAHLETVASATNLTCYPDIPFASRNSSGTSAFFLPAMAK